MKVKRQFYDSSSSLAVTVVLYHRDLKKADRLMMDIVEASDNTCYVLHALLMIANKLEIADGENTQEKRSNLSQVQ